MQCLCLFLTVFLSLLCCIAEAVINLPKNSTIPAVIVFGDSIVDTGNNNNMKTIFKVNYPPYGQDFMGGKPTGRFSDGKVPSDLIAEELGIKALVPAYFDPALQAQDLLTGVNFASGGAGYDPLTSDLASVLSLSDQLEMFKDYITKLKQIAGEERTSSILSKSIFLLVTGSNDIINTYFGTPLRKSNYDISSYTDLLVSYGSSFLQDLYKLGARRIAVFGLPPLGCLPSQRTLKGGAERECVEIYNQVADLFNKKLSIELNSINSQFPDARVKYIDIYNLPLDIIHNPQKYGFRISNKGCCGTGTIEVAFLCKYTCSDASDAEAALQGRETAMQFLKLKLLPFYTWFSFSLPFLSCIAEADPKNITFPAIFFFGDSLVDTGNNNYISTIANANYPPYGKDFTGGKPTGRFSNGKVPSDLFVEELGIKPVLPPYLDPTLKAEDLITGVNFASGGAGYDPMTSHIVSALSLTKQLELFKDYITKLKKIAGEERTSTILRECLIIIVLGSNDITNTYYGGTLRRSHYDIYSYADLLVSYSSGFVQDLYRLGARRIGVFGLAPLGCLPSQRTLKGGAERECVELYNQAAQLFNDKLSAELISVNNRFPDARMIYMDIYDYPFDLFNNPNKYGKDSELQIKDAVDQGQ
ncbi:hypothetical protein RD792_012290 [Penstemon davidsonii]|uniref:GDSL esterase/lipase EXL3 n=1 Tax=Penstemon davidsonii TaxID=160366 RepID=A0ABR0CWW3_9LAMI|nr:hypothetical protein RD792_012290 [Penstemon davidsonii]